MPGPVLLGREAVREGTTADLDPLKITVDVRGLGISGMQAAEWLRAHCHIDIGSSGTCRISGQITHADNDHTENLLVDSLRRPVDHADSIERRPQVLLPGAGELALEQPVLPRDAFFAGAEHVPAEKAVERITAEMLSPYPPGVPVVAPGEVITSAVVDCLRSGVAAGMLVPDASDPSLETFRVTAE